MPEWLNEIAGPDYAMAVLVTGGALLLLFVILLAIRLIRSMSSGTYVAGGRNRKTRLAVMDATAVDSHRRLVLVRRDDVEHLILIGGPTDVVVEQDIRLGQVKRPAVDAQIMQQQPRPQQAMPQQAQRPPAPAPQQQRALPLQHPQAPQQQTAQVPRQPPRNEPVHAPAVPPAQRAQLPRAETKVQQPPIQAQRYTNGSGHDRQSGNDDLDRALMDELSVSLDEPEPARAVTLEDEMNKLLGELSSAKR